MTQLPNGAWLSGHAAFAICPECQKVVRLNKPLFGSLHFCLTGEERAERAAALNTMRMQQQYMADIAAYGPDFEMRRLLAGIGLTESPSHPSV